MANVLIASLGESPIVVPALYHLLKEREEITIDEVHVLAPKGNLVPLSYDLVKETLQDECKVERIDLDFDDANTLQSCLQFLQALVKDLKQQKREENKVYLSLTGGRKSMSALMAWVVPYFSCIEQLYHVLDPKEKQFPSMETMFDHYSDDERKLLMRSSKEERERLDLVEIPFSPELQISSSFFSFLEELDEETLEKIQQRLDKEAPEKAQNENVEAAVTLFQQVNSDEKILEVWVTKLAAEQYKELCKKDANNSRSFRVQYLEKMRTSEWIRALLHSTEKADMRSGPNRLHYCKSRRTVIRPVIYTEPNTRPGGREELRRVVVCALPVKKNDHYPSLEEITSNPKFSLEPFCSIDKLPQMSEDTEEGHILLAPLGTRPMIATQLYTLLTEEEGLPIQEIILFYPGLNREVSDSVRLLERVIREEKRKTGKSIKLSSVKISESDIDSKRACNEFQEKLEEKIRFIRETTPDKRILLSIAGGRKGMAAMSMFVAQKMKLPYVYHTLISDEQRSRDIEDETTVEALNNAPVERNDRLFLRSYDRSLFTLFPVPVLQKDWAIVSDR